MAKDLRTKINELPICEDMELIDTLIAIGTDGKTYRVNKDNIGGKVDDWIFLNYSIASVEREANSMTIRIDCIQFDELFNIGGKIHAYLHRTITEENSVELVELSFIMGSNISTSDEMSGDTYYYFETSGLANENVVFKLNITLIYGGGREEITNAYLQSYTNGTKDNKILDFNVTGIYFEPIPSINLVDEK